MAWRLGRRRAVGESARTRRPRGAGPPPACRPSRAARRASAGSIARTAPGRANPGATSAAPRSGPASLPGGLEPGRALRRPRRAIRWSARPGCDLPRAGPAGPAARACARRPRRRLRLRGLGRRTFHLGQQRLHVVAGHERLEEVVPADDVGPAEASGDGRLQVRDGQVRLAAGRLRPGRELVRRGVARQRPAT